MIRLKDNVLVIEIPCQSETPLEKLCYMQNGLITLIGVIDHDDSPKTEVQDGLWHLRTLLQAMMLGPDQALKINKQALNNADLMNTFK